MTLVEYLKKYHKFDWYVALFDHLGFTDDQIMGYLDISKQTIYNAKNNVEPILKALQDAAPQKTIVYGNPDIFAIIEAFKKDFGTTSASQYDRYAAKRLSEKHGTENVVAIINALAKFGGEQYAPAINSVLELEKKWVSVGKFLQNKIGDQPVDL